MAATNAARAAQSLTAGQSPPITRRNATVRTPRDRTAWYDPAVEPALEQAIEEVRALLTSCYANRYNMHPLVPVEMRVDPDCQDEWCEWKMIPSTYSVADVEQFERGLPTTLPQHLRALLLANHLLDVDFGEVTLPDFPPGKTLSESLWMFMLEDTWPAGYLQIGAGRGCGDPICLDFQAPTADGDYPVVIFNHDRVPRECWASRDCLRPWRSELKPTFREFLRWLLGSSPGEVACPVSAEELRLDALWDRVRGLLKQRGLDPYHRPAGVDPTDPAAIVDFLERGSD